MDLKRSGSQPGELLFEEKVLDPGNGLNVFDGDSGFTTFVGIIFEDLTPVTAYDKDRRSSPFENMSSSRVEFGKQGNLKGTPPFSSLSSSSKIQLRDRSDISITSRFIRTPSVKRERKYYRMK